MGCAVDMSVLDFREWQETIEDADIAESDIPDIPDMEAPDWDEQRLSMRRSFLEVGTSVQQLDLKFN